MITYTFAYYHARHIIGTQFMVMAERMAACSWTLSPCIREQKGVMEDSRGSGNYSPLGKSQERCGTHSILSSLLWIGPRPIPKQARRKVSLKIWESLKVILNMTVRLDLV